MLHERVVTTEAQCTRWLAVSFVQQRLEGALTTPSTAAAGSATAAVCPSEQPCLHRKCARFALTYMQWRAQPGSCMLRRP